MKKITFFILLISVITLQAQNKLHSAIDESYNGATWQNSQGYNYEYDSNNNLITETSLIWNSTNATWQNLYKENYTYNASNKATQNLYQEWNATTQQFENNYRDLYTYTSGNVTQIISQNWQGSQWVNSYKNDITYTGNNVNTLLEYEWNGSQWEVIDRYTATYNANNKIAQVLNEEWNGSQWETSSRDLFTYDANNKIATVTFEAWTGSNWQEEEKTNYLLDASQNRLRETYLYLGINDYKEEYTYDTASLMSNYAHPFADKTGIDYTYEDFPYTNKVLSKNGFFYNTTTSSFENNRRTTYNYTNPITLSTEQIETETNNINIFPNPTNNILNIKQENPYKTSITLYNILGKKVLENEFESSSTTINIAHLQTGVYILKLKTANGTITKRIIKQ